MPKILVSHTLAYASVCASLFFTTGCLQQGGTALSSPAVTTNSGTISTASTSDMGVRVYLRNTDTIGTLANASFRKGQTNFSTTCPSYTPSCLVSPDVYFKPDGQLTEMQSKPDWISSFSVGVTSAPTSTAACAKFNAANESSISVAATAAGTAGDIGYYRVSEYDCLHTSSILTQTGYGATEPLQIRIELDRTKLASTENLLVSLDYSAISAHPELNGNGLGTTNCLAGAGGNPFAASSCAAFIWQLFIHGSDVTSTTPAPFVTVIPPVSKASLVASDFNNGSLIQNRQIIVPLSALEASQYILQLGRTKANILGNNDSDCTANSPLCNGVVFYSVTLYRM